MVFLSAYFDESGTDANSDVATVAGFIAQSHEWLPFSVEWKKCLDKHGIEYFHAVEANGRIEQFEGKSKEERDEIVIGLLEIICAAPLFGIVEAVVKADYDRLLIEYPNSRMPIKHYMYALHNVWIDVCDLAEDGQSSSVNVICEQNQEMRRDANEAFDSAVAVSPRLKRYVKSFGFGDKKTFAPLQAADALAYDFSKQISKRFRDRNCSIRPSLKKLDESMGFYGIRWDYPLLEKVFKKRSDRVEELLAEK